MRPKPLRLVAVVVALVIVAPLAGGAQVIETAVPFDGAGQIRSITPPLAERLGLTPPVWPVTGPYQEARLFETTAGGFVLAVQRDAVRVERHMLGAGQREALRVAVDAGVARTGRILGMDSPDEPAGGAFARNQMILSLLVYGPALAAMSDDGGTAAALYLSSVGASYFVVTGISRRTTITRAQNHLATDGGWRGPLIMNGTLSMLGVNLGRREAAGAVLVGGIGGSIVGFRTARGWTLAEARGSTLGSTGLAATTFGIMGVAGMLGGEEENQLVSALGVGSLMAGYPLGLRYVRTAPYAVTPGDLTALSVGGAVGALTGLSLAMPARTPDDVCPGPPDFGPCVSDPPWPERRMWAGATAGLLAGAYLGDRYLVRPVDHTEAEGRLLWLGALAGSAFGLAGVMLTDPEIRTGMLMISAGAIGGTIAAERLMQAAPAQATGGAGSAGMARFERTGPKLEISPLGAAMAAGRVPGHHGLVRLTF